MGSKGLEKSAKRPKMSDRRLNWLLGLVKAWNFDGVGEGFFGGPKFAKVGLEVAAEKITRSLT